MRTLSIDLETYSEVDLKKSGLYKYAENSEILLFAYAFDDDPVQVISLAEGEDVPMDILKALQDQAVRKAAFNAAFERRILTNWGKAGFIEPSQWECTMVQAYNLGLPGNLDAVGKVLGLGEDKKKLATGKRLINYFSKPCKPTARNGGRTRNLPHHDIEKWEQFKGYCRQDVEAERAIRKQLEWFKQPPVEHALWCIDQKINDMGVLVDRGLAESAIDLDAQIKERTLKELCELTGLDNPNSNMQILEWFTEEEGYTPETLDKKARAELLADGDIKATTRRMLGLKELLSKTSVKKYLAMSNALCKDGRVRGMFQFYGASRTGRFAGRLVQQQNLPQNHLPDLDMARTFVKRKDLTALDVFYRNPSDVLSQLIRTAFVAPTGKKLIVSDFSAIEARVIAWLADETWRQEAFARGEDIYCASASQMFGVPVVKHGVNGELRQKGKVAELACIAEGELVTTDKGLVPIQDVTSDMKVWDGEEWVSHEGVIYQGEKEVITYGGLTATADHLVYINGEDKPVHFGIAAASGAHLLQGRYGREKKKLEAHRGKVRLYDIRNAGPRHRYTVSGVVVHNCGYGGGINALKAFGAEKMGLTEQDMQAIVKQWREASPRICKMWYDVETAAKKAIRLKGSTVKYKHGVEFQYLHKWLLIKLPSGRRLAYYKPLVEVEEEYGKESITYEGAIVGAGGWGRNYTWGGKLVENIVQATARDCLCFSMIELNKLGYKIVMHIHDEVVIEAEDNDTLEAVVKVMSQPIPWAEGLKLDADGYETPYYKKD